MNYDACHSMLVDIIYHAVKDLKTLNENPNQDYVDDDHKAICNDRGFSCGREEIETFFQSPWFEHICDGFSDIGKNDILRNINL